MPNGSVSAALRHLADLRRVRRLSVTLWGTEQWDEWVLPVLDSVQSLAARTEVLRLDLGGNHLGQPTVDRLGNLFQHLTALRSVSLGLQGLLFGPSSDLRPLAFLGHLPRLEELRLHLGYCHIGDAGVAQLLGVPCAGFAALRQLVLDLRSNDIGDVGAVLLSLWLRRLSPRLRSVDVCLSVNGVTALGARAVRHAVDGVPHAVLWLQHNLCAAPP